MNQLLTVNDVAKMTSYSTRMIRRWLQRGELKGIKIGDKRWGHWRVRETDLAEFINGRKTP